MNKGKKRGLVNNMETSKESDSSSNDWYCEICKVILPNESSLPHLLGQKHKKLYIANEERNKIEKKCGLFIKGFPPNVSQDVILNYFSKYGKYIWVHFGVNFMLLDFTESSAVEKIMKESHFLGGKRLYIKYREPRQKIQLKKPEEEDSADIISRLKDVSNFDDQVQMLIQYLQPHAQNQFPKYSQICSDLHNVLSSTFPYCQIHPFGSTITGLHFNNSDVDVFISHIKNDEADVPYLYKIKKILLNSRRFSNIIVIPKAKIPILRCVHVQTGISCDINLKNMLGVCNSQLINYFLSINPKVRRLMMVLKYWAKVHKISGQNNLFSNYSLIMMLIYFLQQDPYNFPSVLMLQQNPYFFNCQDGWNGGFQSIPIYSPSLNDTSLFKLLEGFFSFYSDFDYGINIICPYLGRSVKKDEFLHPEMLPQCFYVYKRYIQFGKPLKVDSSICIQDPFEHSRNTTPIIMSSTLSEFVGFCRLGKKLCKENGNNDHLLYKLLNEIPQNLKSELLIKSGFSQFFIPMQSGLKYIEDKYESLSERRNAWFKTVVKFTTIVLKDFFKFEITEQNTSPSKNKNRKLEGQSDVYETKEINEISYNCLGKLNLWQARKATAKNNASEKSPNASTIVEKEIAITNQLCNLYKDIPQLTDVINFKITFEYNLEPPGAFLKIKKNEAYKNSFKSFAGFVSSNLPSWFNVYEKEQNIGT